ncbi:Fe(2+) transporter permease subunit FeoB [Algihabitans albus]|uniref:Fe(2+) transporter permease subunit FeoB n=1 Tax=Algihabitans albus TaxID=2164067 RepID=UPI000E5D063E|nr:Fe(2+) transporter permease subunit FeoB [Algihabitans albus]
MTSITIALIGNPNTGKTSLFNQLTGLRQRVANWPGVTVEKRSGPFRLGALKGTAVDLPGIYSLAPSETSEDEGVARAYLAACEADVVIDIVDAANIERHLYLAVQLLEQGYPVVVALNMMDVARANGIEIDIAALSRRLGCPVVPLVASRGEGLSALEVAVRQSLRGRSRQRSDLIDHGQLIEDALGDIAVALMQGGMTTVPARRTAIRLIEGDSNSLADLAPDSTAAVAARLAALERDSGAPSDLLLAEGRYGFIMAATGEVVQRRRKLSRAVSDRIDRVTLHRALGLPIFLGLMYLMFLWTISIGGAFIDFFDILAGTLFVDGVAQLLAGLSAPIWLSVILADGIGGGLQTVATFIPIIGCLFLFLAVLEDSGYMARAAFVMDRFMRTVGLPGKAFLPLLVGFGCSVPGVMGTRILSDARDRKTTIMMIPFMSCGARVPVYALFAAAFFPVNGQNLVFVLYIVGILVAILTGFALKRTLLIGSTAGPAVIELPRYHLPTLRNVFLRTWDRLKVFVRGAGKIIVLMVMALSILGAVSHDGSFGEVAMEESLLADVGRAITPAFAPMGIEEDNWPATVGIFTGLLAKEAVVGTLDSLYGALAASDAGATQDEEAVTFSLLDGLAEAATTVPENLGGVAAALLDPLGIAIGEVSELDVAAEVQEVSTGTFGAMVERFDGQIGAFAYLLFVLLYFPCFAAMGAIYRELGFGWTAFAGVWTTGLAYGVATSFYQAARWPQDPFAAASWIAGVLIALALSLAVMRWLGLRDETAPLVKPAE